MAEKKTIKWIEVKTSDYAPWINWDEVDEVVGKVTELRFSDSLGKWVMEVEKEDGEKVSIGETGLLKFKDIIKIGMEIKIVNQGWRKLPSGRRARNLILYVREPF